MDKPPLAFWVEAGSAKIFGVSSLSLLLPEAIAGVLGVWVLYLLVARVFGGWAGVVAALALAVSPVAVAVNRDNNPDALFVALLVVAAYCGVRAIEGGRFRWLLATAVVVGLAFNTKMLVALVVVPGLGLAYLLFAPRSWRVRLWQLAGATLALLAVSGAWIAAVALTPAANRPWISGTSSNSALSLVFGYNGFGRVTGQTGGTSTGRGGGVLFSGSPGPLRLINDAMGDQGGWLLPLALIGGALALVLAIRARDRMRMGSLVIIGGWFRPAPWCSATRAGSCTPTTSPRSLLRSPAWSASARPRRSGPCETDDCCCRSWSSPRRSRRGSRWCSSSGPAT